MKMRKKLLATTALGLTLLSQRGSQWKPPLAEGTPREQVIQSLDMGATWPVKDEQGTTVIEYAFDETTSDPLLQQIFEQTFEEYMDTANLKFVRRESADQFENKGILITSMNITPFGAAGFAPPPLPFVTAERLYIDDDFSAPSQIQDAEVKERITDFLRHLSLHETLHKLGAKEPDYSWVGYNDSVLDKKLNHGLVTVMSYDNKGGADKVGGYSGMPITLMQGDVDFLRGKYGYSKRADSVETVVVVLEEEGKKWLTKFFPENAEILDVRTSKDLPVNMDLRKGPNHYSMVGNLQYTLPLNGKLRNVLTGPSDDHIHGNDQANILSAGDGENYLNGAGGNDLLSGGSGKDHYGYDGNDGYDVIDGFNLHSDKIYLGEHIRTDYLRWCTSKEGTHIFFCDEAGKWSGVLLRDVHIKGAEEITFVDCAPNQTIQSEKIPAAAKTLYIEEARRNGKQASWAEKIEDEPYCGGTKSPRM